MSKLPKFSIIGLVILLAVIAISLAFTKSDNFQGKLFFKNFKNKSIFKNVDYKKLVPITKVPSPNPPTTQDVVLSVGDKLAISNQLNIRIESIHNNDLTFSIWGKDNNNQCKIISNSGSLSLLGQGYSSREFVDAFIELISIDNNRATIRKYIGKAARERCFQVIPQNQQPVWEVPHILDTHSERMQNLVLTQYMYGTPRTHTHRSA